MGLPLVSVITATWHRHDVLINRCIPSVKNQTYPNIEHIIVSDGLDSDLKSLEPSVIELGHNQQVMQDHWGAIPRLVGSYLARGEYIAYLDDDNEYLPNHIEILLEHLQESGAGVAYGQLERFVSYGQVENMKLDVIGDGIVELGRIDTSMILHRAELLWTAGNWEAAGYCSDWDLFRRWRDVGVQFTFVPEVTCRWYKTLN